MLQKKDGEYALLGVADINAQYINQGEVQDRLTQPTTLNMSIFAADGIDLVIISNAPAGTFTATNTTTSEAVTGPISGSDSFATTVPGTYKIKIESWPYLDFNAEIVAI